MLTLFLTSIGHRVWAAIDGNQASHILGQTNVHVLLTDILLPTVSGWDLLQNLKMKDLLPPFVITMSSLHVWDVMHLSKAAGCHAHLAKPISDKELVATLERAGAAVHPPA